MIEMRKRRMGETEGIAERRKGGMIESRKRRG